MRILQINASLLMIILVVIGPGVSFTDPVLTSLLLLGYAVDGVLWALSAALRAGKGV